MRSLRIPFSARQVQRLRWIRFRLTCKLHETKLEDLLLGHQNVHLRLPVITRDPETGSVWDHTALGILVHALKPRRCFEIGTSMGITTAIIASNSPDCRIDTLDLSRDARIGSFFRERPEAERIRQHTGSSREFSFEPFHGQMDLVLIDGSHEFEDVVCDTRTAMRMLSPGGIVLWHDVGPDWQGVVRALEMCEQSSDICRLAGTGFGFYAAAGSPLQWKAERYRSTKASAARILASVAGFFSALAGADTVVDAFGATAIVWDGATSAVSLCNLLAGAATLL